MWKNWSSVWKGVRGPEAISAKEATVSIRSVRGEIGGWRVVIDTPDLFIGQQDGPGYIWVCWKESK